LPKGHTRIRTMDGPTSHCSNETGA
jgi:hypothetical protein